MRRMVLAVGLVVATGAASFAQAPAPATAKPAAPAPQAPAAPPPQAPVPAPAPAPALPFPEGASYPGFIFARGATPQEVEQALRTAYRQLRLIIAPALELL